MDSPRGETIRVEVLLVADCANRQLALDRLQRALTEVDMSNIAITTRIIADEAEAERAGFTGSPTILIDGRDPFAEPSAATTAAACRIYHGPNGPSGAPTVEQLKQALRSTRAAD
ncbi:hypothetical protein [Nocardia australiensis]|uniref:hypothetical protein n=1 Tax=Nocardia australiensis TaxID=2887191 RepID=UPI001D1583C4|nr:hypothetical protein [Nocardia australiensis]